MLRYYEPRAALVFCTTREAVKRMHARLVERGFAAVALSGELTQHERTQALVAVRDGRARVLVATDVAARGLDLPDLALVIHAELPNDRETLLHRSGRTGRAGKKGMCLLVVPFKRRRKAETLLGAARLQVTWAPAPTADEIRARDQERFLADPVFAETATDAERGLAKILQAGRSADEIALALVRLHRARLPEPEDLAEDAGPPRRDDRGRATARRTPERSDASDRASRTSGRARRARKTATVGDNRSSDRVRLARRAAPRDDGREMVWFRLNIGRERNADPKWILPLICKAGGISKSEIGAIKIYDRDTRFQIAAEHADQFAEAVRTNKNKEGHIARVSAHPSADDATVMAAIKALPQSTAKQPTPDRDDPRPKAPYVKAAYSKDPHYKSSQDKAHHSKAPHSKAPWRDRKAAKAAAPRTAADQKQRPDERSPMPDRRAAKGPDAKYLHKRKHRLPAVS